MAGPKNMEANIAAMESRCSKCNTERLRRNRIWDLAHFNVDDFYDAPALYSFNIPKYFTRLLRAQNVARRQKVHLTWTYSLSKAVEDSALP